MLALEVHSRAAAQPFGLALLANPRKAGGPAARGRGHGQIGISPDGYIESVNAAAEALLGWRLTDLVGKPVLALTGARTGQALSHGSAVLRALQTGQRLRLEHTQFRCRSGEFRPVTCVAAPPTGEAQGLTLTFQPWAAGEAAGKEVSRDR